MEMLGMLEMLTTFQEIKQWQNVSLCEWNDWHWQLKNAIRSVVELRNMLGGLPMLSIEDKAISDITQIFEMKLTPHTILNIYRATKAGDNSGLRALTAAFIPSVFERAHMDNYSDYIGEELKHAKPTNLVTNFYKTRVLLFAANMCPSYCRFCFRRRKIGDRVSEEVERGTDPEALERAIQYIRKNNSIREVIISGGEPLILDDDKLFSLLYRLKEIEHIRVLRIDTKALTTLPQRLTSDLVQELRRFQPLYIVGNFLHPTELTTEVLNAVSLLIDAGMQVFSHTALLKGINDDAEIVYELMWNLYANRVIPYYLIQFIPTKWTEHFRVPIKKGLEIMENVHGRLSGIANPTYIVYLPEGAGKVPLLPNYVVAATGNGYYLRNFEGRTVLYEEGN